MTLRERLEHGRASGRKLLVPYIVAGIPEPTAFGDALVAVAAWADAVELGLPYSDPLMDGPVLASAAERAVAAGVGPLEALELVPDDLDAPPIAMTYYNPVHRLGEEEFCGRLARRGFAGLIVPDLPLEESEALRSAAAQRDIAWIPLVAPTSSRERVQRIAATATGFVYAVSTLGVTGVRESLSERAARVVEACRQATDLPVLVGIGVSTPAQARQACAAADGVVIGSAVVKLVLEQGAPAAGAFLSEVRAALDEAFPAEHACVD